VPRWYEHINAPTLADGIMNTLYANSMRIELKGNFRRIKTKN